MCRSRGGKARQPTLHRPAPLKPALYTKCGLVFMTRRAGLIIFFLERRGRVEAVRVCNSGAVVVRDSCRRSHTESQAERAAALQRKVHCVLCAFFRALYFEWKLNFLSLKVVTPPLDHCCWPAQVAGHANAGSKRQPVLRFLPRAAGQPAPLCHPYAEGKTLIFQNMSYTFLSSLVRH